MTVLKKWVMICVKLQGVTYFAQQVVPIEADQSGHDIFESDSEQTYF